MKGPKRKTIIKSQHKREKVIKRKVARKVEHREHRYWITIITARWNAHRSGRRSSRNCSNRVAPLGVGSWSWLDACIGNAETGLHRPIWKLEVKGKIIHESHQRSFEALLDLVTNFPEQPAARSRHKILCLVVFPQPTAVAALGISRNKTSFSSRADRFLLKAQQARKLRELGAIRGKSHNKAKGRQANRVGVAFLHKFQADVVVVI